MNANVWSFEVVEWIKSGGPDRIEVLSPPSACGASADRLTTQQRPSESDAPMDADVSAVLPLALREVVGGGSVDDERDNSSSCREISEKNDLSHLDDATFPALRRRGRVQQERSHHRHFNYGLG